MFLKSAIAALQTGVDVVVAAAAAQVGTEELGAVPQISQQKNVLVSHVMSDPALYMY